jgi:hypothetical protein
MFEMDCGRNQAAAAGGGAWVRLGVLAILGFEVSQLLGQAAKPAQIPPGELVRITVANEVAAAHDTSVKHMFRSRRQTPKGSQTRLYVETEDAMAGMLIAINDRPLTPQQQQVEANHLAWLMNNPEQLRKKKEREKEDAERTLRILQALPDAFHYQYESSPEGGSEVASPILRLSFTPNPAYNPPSRVEQVLEGMKGFLLIDASAKRIARIDGTLFKDVTFGWGFIGRLEKGGHFVVQQADVGDSWWEITEMSLNLAGKILLFKPISMVSEETFTDFRKVPGNLTFRQAVQMLKSEQEKMAAGLAPQHAAAGKNP